MKRKRLSAIIIILLSFCLIATFFTFSDVYANGEDDDGARTAAWYTTQYGTGPLGQTWMIGRFGPDVGYGEEGFRYEYRDPASGVFVSYQNTGLGVGLCCPFAGYGGRYSSLGALSYGPYALGGEPQVQPTLGWSTTGAITGGLFQPQTSFFQAQPFLGLFGGFSGFGGLGGYPNVGFGSYYGYPASSGPFQQYIY
jgi:hypothetical protein